MCCVLQQSIEQPETVYNHNILGETSLDSFILVGQTGFIVNKTTLLQLVQVALFCLSEVLFNSVDNGCANALIINLSRLFALCADRERG